MTSTLSRLFLYAKATGADAIENFTTEALAGAIRSDPSPFIRALASISIELSASLVEVATQVKLDREAGTLDLLLVPKHGQAVAIEVKVHAGQTGNQLDRYIRWSETFDASTRPRIVVLSAFPITTSAQLPWLTWQRVWQEIGVGTTNCHWADFRVWLEEHRMADDSFEPVHENEASSLRAAHGLLRKSVKILVDPSIRMNKEWPHSNWPSDEKEVLKQITQRFRRWPSYTVERRSNRPSGCVMGVYHEPSDDSAWVGIWLWSPPKRIRDRDQIRGAARNLPACWEYDASPWELLGAYHRLLDFSGPEAASKWLLDRITELVTVGMFTVLDQTKPGDEERDEPPE